MIEIHDSIIPRFRSPTTETSASNSPDARCQMPHLTFWDGRWEPSYRYRSLQATVGFWLLEFGPTWCRVHMYSYEYKTSKAQGCQQKGSRKNSETKQEMETARFRDIDDSPLAKIAIAAMGRSMDSRHFEVCQTRRTIKLQETNMKTCTTTKLSITSPHNIHTT